jgi:hypothetical protein
MLALITVGSESHFIFDEAEIAVERWGGSSWDPVRSYLMSRYVTDIATSATADEVDRIVSASLTSEGFGRAAYGHEQVWKKGHGISMPQFITVAGDEGHAHLEAWLKYPILPGVYVGGEMDMEGKLGFVMKKKLREQVEHLEQALSSDQ